MMQHRDSAVSPVVGVMLMLVVTIIIAAVVSAFAGGLAGNQQKTPQATLAVNGVIQNIEGTYNENTFTTTYPTGFTAANGLQFENTGGDTFSLSDISIQLQSQDTKYTISYSDRYNSSAGANCLPSGITNNAGYFKKIGNSSVADISIAPGDKFMIYADNCHLGYTSSYDNNYYGPQISWKPMGASGGFAAFMNTKLQYKVIDKASSRVISSGELYLTQ